MPVFKTLILVLWIVDAVNCEFVRKDFFHTLFKGYESNFQPKENVTEDVDIHINYRIISINHVSEIDQYIETACKLLIKWTDQFLRWDSTVPGSPKYITVSADKLWVPTIVVFNTFDNGQRYVSKDAKLIVQANGDVVWASENIFKTSCKIDIAKFPFDQQTCSIVFSPPFTHYSPYIFRLLKGKGLTSVYQESNEWSLVDTKVYKQYFNISPIIHPDKGDLVLDMIIQRKYAFHVIKGVVPPTCLSILNCFVFRLPAASGERLTMALSVLLSYTIYLSFITESLPENSDRICIFSIYLTSILLLSIAIIIGTIRSIALHCGTHDLPPWLCWMLRKRIQTVGENMDESHRATVSQMYDKLMFIISICATCLVTVVCFTIMLC
ncbi:hypothetical protein SNE40_005288 [Patella caerulea]|uniref:Uncharacterized protein n=1 Tax=Patella caerulea TaxID=87958 RepID=A0AAN8Q4H2_PATCE